MRIALVCAAVFAVAPFAVGAQEAGRNLAATCAMCHGTTGHSVGGNEPLAGLPQDHIATQMRAFRDGKRPATVMHQIAKGYTDAQIDAIAGWYAGDRKSVV